MVEFYGNKPEVIKIGERIKMLVLKKHDKYEEPPHNRELLILIDTGSRYTWTIGLYDDFGFWSEYDYQGREYDVIEWYELPTREKVKEDYSYYQMKLEDFWKNK